MRAGSGEERVEEIGSNEYKVWVREAPERGLANKAVIYALAKHLGVAQSSLKIISGHTSRTKIIALA